VTGSIDLSAIQIDALASMCSLLSGDRWSLIGASALRCRIELPRPTADVDLAVLTSSAAVEHRFQQAGWQRHPKMLQRWQREGAQVDIVPTTNEELLAGVADLGDGFLLSVVGFDLAFTETDPIEIRANVVVPVARLAVLAMLKMVAWLERPIERRKDLGDIVLIWDGALPDDDERRWDPGHPVGAAGLDFDDQSAFFCGWELGKIAAPGHLHWAKRFVDAMRDAEGAAAADLVFASRYVGDDADVRVRAKLTAFERGLQLGAEPPAVRGVIAPPVVATPASGLLWGRSGSLQMLLHDAIDQRRVIEFRYHGKWRIAEPHVLGTKGGRLQLLTWQTGGASTSGDLPDWRRFAAHELRDLRVTDAHFPGRRLTFGRHSDFDRQIVVVR
jgi:predicted nucleotidyltransferase